MLDWPMTQNQNIIPKLLLWTIVIHAVLIVLTISEVFIYSTFFNAGQAMAAYEQHAQKYAPYIAIIAGFAIIYVVAVRLKRKNANREELICFGLPIGYILLDVVILLMSGTDWKNNFTLFSISYTTKLLAGYLALKIT